MSSPQPARPKRKRRWLQYSLRSLLVLTLLAAIGLGWVRHQLNRLQAEEEAVAAIRALGGTVVYGSDSPFEDESPGPKWLRSLLGEHFFCEVWEVDFPRGADDEVVRHLDRLRTLKRLVLRGARVTRAGLEPVWRKRRLTYLDLGSTALSDDDSPWFAELPELEELYLDNTPITDRAVAGLNCLSKLRLLCVSGTHVTLEGVRQLPSGLPLHWGPAPSERQRQAAAGLEQWGAVVNAELSNDFEASAKRAVYDVFLDQGWEGGAQQIDQLRALGSVRHLEVKTTLSTASWERLTRGSARSEHNQPPGEGERGARRVAALNCVFLTVWAIHDADLQYICRWSHLDELAIIDAPITDAGLAHLARVRSLRSLYLVSCRGITGSGLAHLRAVTGLEYLDLSGTNVGDPALAHIAAIRSLLFLRLTDTRLTDAGLRHLTSLRNLQDLDLRGTQVTAAGVAALRAAFSDRYPPPTIHGPGESLSEEPGAEDASTNPEDASDEHKPQKSPR